MATEKFVLLARGARGAACRGVIEEALASADLYVFSELLETPTVQELKETADRQYVDLLELFAYGTYADYKARSGALPVLNAAQMHKLRTLTLIGLASSHKSLSYASLLAALELSTLRELEDLIIDAMYKSLVGGRLDQVQQQFEVEFAVGRDVRAGDVAAMRAVLEQWCTNCAGVLGMVGEEMERANSSKTAAKQKNDQLQSELEKMKRDVVAVLQQQAALLDVGDGLHGMEYDEDRRRSKRVQRMTFLHRP